MIHETGRAEIRRLFEIKYGPARAGIRDCVSATFDTAKEAVSITYLIKLIVQTCIVEPFIFELWDEKGVRYWQETVKPLYRSIQLKRRRHK